MFLGIFTGIEMLFFILGVLTTLTFVGLGWLKLAYKVGVKPLVVLGIGLLIMIAAIAWSVSSVLEGEPQAGSMGLMVIFLPGLVVASLGARQVYSAVRQLA